MTDQPTIVYVSHREQQCGVYQFGRRIASALERSQAYDFRYRECTSAEDLQRAIETDRPALMIYNYHPSTLPWVTPTVTRRIPIPQVGTIHEVTQDVADRADNRLFDYHVAADPTLLLKNPLVFKTGRFVATYVNRFLMPEVPTIGSFGFGTAGKGLETLIATVQENFDVARVRLHLPSARFGDQEGARARELVGRCQALLYKPGIVLEPTHEFLDEPQLLDFLAQNTCNAFFYIRDDSRGISSVLDYALAVQRPVAIRRTPMMRHVWNAMPSICIEDRTLPEIIAAGTTPIEPFAEQWCAANLVWDYERIVRKVLAAYRPESRTSRSFVRRAVRAVKRRLLPQGRSDVVTTNWVGDTSATVETSLWRGPDTYPLVTHGPADRYNRILDDAARELYRTTIAKLFQMLPDLMARKIPRANVQQAFALDTVARLAASLGPDAKLLCVGSYEDSACWGLKRLGHRIEEVDPVMNYDLAEFLSRPTTKGESYDVVFSVSVLEHVPDDEAFVSDIASLIKSGGYAVLTCDFRPSYKAGDPKPQSDWRLYTEADLRDRLLPKMTGCRLVDEPSWQCATPDFHWENCTYTFASLVVQKEP